MRGSDAAAVEAWDRRADAPQALRLCDQGYTDAWLRRQLHDLRIQRLPKLRRRSRERGMLAIRRGRKAKCGQPPTGWQSLVARPG